MGNLFAEAVNLLLLRYFSQNVNQKYLIMNLHTNLRSKFFFFSQGSDRQLCRYSLCQRWWSPSPLQPMLQGQFHLGRKVLEPFCPSGLGHRWSPRLIHWHEGRSYLHTSVSLCASGHLRCWRRIRLRYLVRRTQRALRLEKHGLVGLESGCYSRRPARDSTQGLWCW